jgi:hypothetical protein
MLRQLKGEVTSSSKMWQSLNYVRMRVRNPNYIHDGGKAD